MKLQLIFINLLIIFCAFDYSKSIKEESFKNSLNDVQSTYLEPFKQEKDELNSFKNEDNGEDEEEDKDEDYEDEDEDEDGEEDDSANDGLNPKICGASVNTRVIGGKETKPNQYPWMAAIMFKRGMSSFCGAVIISKRFILTAAHCLTGKSKESLTIRLGAHKFSGRPEPKSKDFDIEKWVIHEKYGTHLTGDDIALIKLKTKIKYTHSMKPICLPPKNSPSFAGKKATIAGWGWYTLSNNVGSPTLRHAHLKVLSKNKCKKSWNNHKGITNKTICAFGKDKSSCKGDSGGPLMIRDNRNRWMSIGVVSWGVVPCEKRPTVYTRITQYIGWIEKKVKTM